jgi:hypothetical protein
MIERILHSRHFLACLLSAATGMALYFRAPFPEDNIFLRAMAIRSLSAFLFLKYSYTLLLYTTPCIAYSILLSGVYIFALKTGRRIRAGKLPLYSDPRKRAELLSWWARHITPVIKYPRNAALAGHSGTRAVREHSDRGCCRLWKNGKLYVPHRRADFGVSRPGPRPAHRRTHFGSEWRLLRESAGILARHGRAAPGSRRRPRTDHPPNSTTSRHR